MGDWLDLAAEYFEPISRAVFDDYLKGHGFRHGQADQIGALTYRRDRTFLRVHYYVEDSPNYAPMVTLGRVRNAWLRPVFDGIGLWYAIPSDDTEARAYELWRFSDAEQLEGVLIRLRREVIEVHARPLWEHPEQLAGLVRKRRDEMKAERQSEVVKRKKIEAERAFRAADYRLAATLYGQMDESSLSALERKRYALSTKYRSGSR